MAGIGNYIKTGFGLGIGVIGAQMIFILLGVVFFILGQIELKKARANGGSLVFPYILMVLGVVFVVCGIAFKLGKRVLRRVRQTAVIDERIELIQNAGQCGLRRRPWTSLARLLCLLTAFAAH